MILCIHFIKNVVNNANIPMVSNIAYFRHTCGIKISGLDLKISAI